MPDVVAQVAGRQPQLSAFERRALARLPAQTNGVAGAPTLNAGAPLIRLLELRRRLMIAGRLS